jgi:NADH dehydrogenase (ubiquinone) 1 alpha subcomplex subunit 13
MGSWNVVVCEDGVLTGTSSELAREKMWSRIYLIPMLTAEEDRDLVRRHLADQNREKELLGKTTSAYNSDRYDLPEFDEPPLHL